MMFGLTSDNLDIEMLRTWVFMSKGIYKYTREDVDLVAVPFANMHTIDAEIMLDSDNEVFGDEQ